VQESLDGSGMVDKSLTNRHVLTGNILYPRLIQRIDIAQINPEYLLRGSSHDKLPQMGIATNEASTMNGKEGFAQSHPNVPEPSWVSIMRPEKFLHAWPNPV